MNSNMTPVIGPSDSPGLRGGQEGGSEGGKGGDGGGGDGGGGEGGGGAGGGGDGGGGDGGGGTGGGDGGGGEGGGGEGASNAIDARTGLVTAVRPATPRLAAREVRLADKESIVDAALVAIVVLAVMILTCTMTLPAVMLR